MSLLAEIKAKQLAELNETGENPYAVAVVEVVLPVVTEQNPVAEDPAAWSLLAEIKAQQQQDAVKTGKNPYADQSDTADHTPVATPAELQTLQHYQAALSADLASLATIKDVTEKAIAKGKMLDTYWPFVEAYVKNGDNYPNDVAVYVCIWLFDTLDIERGLDLAAVLIKQNQITPPKFDRDLVTFVCDALYDWANALLKQGQSASPYLDAWVASIDSEGWNIAPPVHSKLLVMLAKHKNRVLEYHTVVALCEAAEKVNPDGAGVKKLKADALAKLKKSTDGE